MDSAVVFVPGDPPRTGHLAVYPLPPADDRPPGAPGKEDLVVETAAGFRRRRVDAWIVSLGDALGWLGDGAVPASGSESGRAWSVAAQLGLQLIARGRLVPTASAGGWDSWRVGPLDPEDASRLGEVAAALPLAGHAVPVDGGRVRSPAPLVREFWDALADTLVRTPAAASTVAHPAFADRPPVAVGAFTEWLADADRAVDASARPGLRVELPEGPDGAFRAVLQLRSTADPSLVIDAADLWDAPAAVLSRMGDDADTDVFLALRRAARVWPPVARLLDEARPEVLELDDGEAIELLGSVASDLATIGVEVLWPAELAATGLSLVARATPTPAPVTGAGLHIDTLLDFEWQVALGDEPLTPEEMAALAEAKRPLVRLRGRWVTVDPTLVERLRGRRPRRLTGIEALAAALTREVEVDGERIAFAPGGVLADVVARLERADLVVDPPADLCGTLRPYQERGLAWLLEKAALGVGGCLADDMGLGKTLQVIALHLAWRGGPALVVCPTSLLGNWERELGRFAPSVPVRRFHGGDRNLQDIADNEVVLVTYGVVRRDHDALAAMPWGLVIADEAQHAKNPLSRTARTLRALPAKARIALTGTPVENRLTELWSILDWTTPGLLGPLETFRREVAVPVERYRDDEATERLTRLVAPFLLRRRKTDPGIAPELPAKTETDVVVPLTAEQTTLYEAVVRETMAEIEAADGIARRGLVLKLITALKQVCNHPAQFLHQAGPLPGRSGKLAGLDELLDVILDEGDSTLVFTQYVEMAALIEAHLRAHGVPTAFLHGRVPARRREAMVASFQAGEVPVFLLSLRAGGTGLNLTRATHVVHYDRWWNPAVEDQASDRAYRIGQDRPVQIHRLVTEGTLEDRIAAVLASKRELASRVVGAGEAWIGELSDTELAALVELGARP